jgi:hypothetical protein
MTLTVVCCRVFLYAACGLGGFTNARAACKPDGPPLTPAMIKDFLQKPEIVLDNDASSKRAARALSVSVSQYAAANQATVQALKSVLPGTVFQQRVAIGEGLYTAVIFCRPIDPAVATRIESGVKLIGDKDVILAYRIIERLSESSTTNSEPETLTAFASAKPSTRAAGLIGEPTPKTAGNLDLKLSDPFGSPDAWR